MKKLLLTTLSAIILAPNLLAQTEKGNWLPGLGVASAGGAFNENNSSASFNINPSVGYFIKDNLSVGTAVGLGFGTSKGTHYISYGLHPFIRPYFSKMDSRTKLFGEATLGVSGNKLFGESVGQTGADYLFMSSVKLGSAYFLSPDVSVETTFGVMALGLPVDPLSAILVPSIGIGFRAYINRKVNCWQKN